MVEEFKQGKPVSPVALYIFPQVLVWQQFYSIAVMPIISKNSFKCVFSVIGFEKYVIILKGQKWSHSSLVEIDFCVLRKNIINLYFFFLT